MGMQSMHMAHFDRLWLDPAWFSYFVLAFSKMMDKKTSGEERSKEVAWECVEAYTLSSQCAQLIQTFTNIEEAGHWDDIMMAELEVKHLSFICWAKISSVLLLSQENTLYNCLLDTRATVHFVWPEGVTVIYCFPRLHCQTHCTVAWGKQSIIVWLYLHCKLHAY